MRDRLLYTLLCLNVLVVAGLAAKTIYDYRAYRSLISEGRTASATVRGVHVAVRNRAGDAGRWALDYSFTTPANETINGNVGLSRERAAAYRVGQRIDVVYDPADPSLSALSPEQAWALFVYDEWILVPYLATLMALAWMLIERRRRT
jgi:hypothetical protein